MLSHLPTLKLTFEHKGLLALSEDTFFHGMKGNQAEVKVYVEYTVSLVCSAHRLSKTASLVGTLEGSHCAYLNICFFSNGEVKRRGSFGAENTQLEQNSVREAISKQLLSLVRLFS